MLIEPSTCVTVSMICGVIFSLPLQIGVALYLLYMQVKFAFAAGVAITALLIPVNKWISTLIAAATQKMMKQKEEKD